MLNAPKRNVPWIDTVDGSEILHQLRLVVYHIIYRVLYIPRGAGFLINSRYPTRRQNASVSKLQCLKQFFSDKIKRTETWITSPLRFFGQTSNFNLFFRLVALPWTPRYEKSTQKRWLYHKVFSFGKCSTFVPRPNSSIFFLGGCTVPFPAFVPRGIRTGRSLWVYQLLWFSLLWLGRPLHPGVGGWMRSFWERYW